MAKQTGILQIEGSVGGFTFWVENGVNYVKKKSSLSGKKVKTSPRFANTMRNARWMAAASTIASAVYRSLPRQSRELRMHRAFVGQALEMVRQGMTKEDILDEMRRRHAPLVGKEVEGVNENKETKDLLSSAGKDERDDIAKKSPESLQQYVQWMNTSAALIYIVAVKNQDDEQVLHKEWVVPWYSAN